ncbi:hypothetical protein B0A48_05575 [Cryoendolithus antarcticus]|uniref:Myb-like domain-containing protein n=1 Tax=Cryoendolithus antarcticus TaxID=1507870 RepID=A0A1V8TIX0_9PEZI|nr:hypothetical protein B0A48_05575 [Cryoendolithus antarcticus]
MASTAKGWTEAEKLGLLFQIIARSGTIPWPELELPAGRTVKACQVMIDKEKKKVKDTMAERAQKNGDDGEQGDGVKSKRKATTDENGGKAKRGRKAKQADEGGDGDGEETTTLKLKKGRSKKAVTPKVEPQSDDDTGALEAAEEAKAEAEAEDEGAED